MRKATVFLALVGCLFLSACGARSKVGAEKQPIALGGSMSEGNSDNGSSLPKKVSTLEDVKNQEANSSMGGGGGARPKGGIQGGAFSETQRTESRRGSYIVLPSTYGSVATSLDKALPEKQKVACVVVEHNAIRKVKTRGICKLLRSQNANCEVISFADLKTARNLRSLLTTARSEKADVLVILEKKGARSFVILDTRNAVVLGQGSGNSQQLVPGNKTLLALHESLCKIWATQ